MSKLLKYIKFLEKNIDLPELKKPSIDGKRGDTLVRKLTDNEPLKTGNREVTIRNAAEVVDNITTNGDYDTVKADNFFKNNGKYQDVLEDETGEEFKLTQFKKTREFGSSGAGRLVREFESVQAIFIAIKQGNPDVELNTGNLIDVFNEYVNLPEKLVRLPDIEVDESLIQDFIQDPDWVETFCAIPNRLWSNDIYIDKEKTYLIYQVSYKGSPIDRLKSKYNDFAKSGGYYRDINFAKWCPADIYLIQDSEDLNFKRSIEEANSIEELSDLVDRLFDSKIFIPISLKKTSINSNFIIITNREVGKELPNFEIDKMQIGSDMKGSASKLIVISYWEYDQGQGDGNERYPIENRRSLILRSSDTKKKRNIDAEVDGHSTRHGKISLNSILSIIRSYFPELLEDDLGGISSNSNLIDKDIDELGQMVTRLITEIQRHELYEERIICAQITRGTDISGNIGMLISRIQSLQVVLIFLKTMSSENADATISKKKLKKGRSRRSLSDKTPITSEIITKIMRYALSIQTDKFNTPRYLRIM